MAKKRTGCHYMVSMVVKTTEKFENTRNGPPVQELIENVLSDITADMDIVSISVLNMPDMPK